MWRIALGTALLAIASTGVRSHAAERVTGASAPTSSAVGQKVDNFTLNDFRGKSHSLAELAERDVVVLAFIGCECPLAKLYGPRLAELANEFEGRGVAFLAIDSN